MRKSGESGQDLYANYQSFTYDQTSGIHLMAIHCVAAKHGEMIKNKERRFMGKT